jgi:hypothetical protein
MRKKVWKRVLTIALIVSTVVVLGGIQPMFFHVKTYFGVNLLAIMLPLSGVFMVITGFHLYQNWPLLRLWFKKTANPKKRWDRRKRAIVLIAFVAILGYDIASAWYYALRYGLDGMPMAQIRIWSWVATGLLVVHVWQRWRLTASYFKPKAK